MARGPEHAVQTPIVKALHALYDCRVASNNNGGYRTRTEAYALADLGTWAGYPDLSIFGRLERMFFIECKAKIQARERAVSPFDRFWSLSASQKVAIPELRDRGFRVAVVDNVEEAIAAARDFGLGPKLKIVAPARLATGF
jgi:hypothetical protein